jgi:hypothetical protein
MLAGIGGRGSSRGRHLGFDTESLMNGAREVLNARVDSHLIVYIRVERNLILQISMEFGPLSTPEVSAIRWVVEG